MPIRIDPKGHDSRIELFTRALSTTTTDQVAGRTHIHESWIDDVAALLTIYQVKATVLIQKVSAHSLKIQERDGVVEKLSLYLRHGWQVLKFRVERLGQPISILQLYGLPLYGMLPRNVTIDEWLRYGYEFVAGDAIAVAQGFEAMVNPSAAEVQTMLAQASIQIDDVAVVDAALDEAQASIADEVSRADELYRDLIDYLEFATRKQNAPSQRRTMRRYGIKFAYRTGEPPELDEPPTPESVAATDAPPTLPTMSDL